MWTGTPAPMRPAGGHICTQLSDASLLPVCFSLAARAPRLAPPVRQCGRPLTRSVPAASKDAAPAIVSYTVQKGETLWDIAIQHGVSMRTIKDLNKLSGKEPVLAEGQQLLVPASGITAVATVDGAMSAVALGSTPARGLWVGSEYVRLASVQEAKELYLRQCDRGNSQNTLLVLYAPWCPHCRDMEDELERLAEGLSHVPAVRVVAVNCDSLEGRMFAREVLGVAYYPSIISFPEHARTFFKYKGRQRDAESLLRFLNMTCCAREDQMWSLRPVGTHAAVAVPGGKWVNQMLPVGTAPGAMAVGLLALVTAAAVAVMTLRRRAATAAAAAAAGDSAAVEPDVVAELDSSLGRMASLMVRAIGTRLALLFQVPGSAHPAPADGATNGTKSGIKAATSSATVASMVKMEPAAADARVPVATQNASHGSSNGSVQVATVATASSQPSDGAALPLPMPPLDRSRVRPELSIAGTAVAAAAPITAAAASTPDASLGMAPTRGLTVEERMRLTRLTDDELIALVNSDPDLDKVLSRLLGDK